MRDPRATSSPLRRPVLPQVPALVVGGVSHARVQPLQHSFSHRSYQWLVDVDEMPRLPRWLRPLASFSARDHLAGGAGGGIRGDLAEFLSAHGIDLAATDRVLMLTNARVLGHVFDPLTVYWVHDAEGDPVAVVMEVHNTYGERHNYLLQLDENGRTTTEKQFYVSPFNDVSGTYAIRIRLEADRVRVTVNLDRDGERVFSATTRGAVVPATTRAVLGVALRHLPMPHRVSALIRFHGIRLWARRLPVQPRPPHPSSHQISAPGGPHVAVPDHTSRSTPDNTPDHPQESHA